MPEKILEDKGGRKLVVSLLGNADIMFYRVIDGRRETILDLPNPITGGGDEKMYRFAREIYDCLSGDEGK